MHLVSVSFVFTLLGVQAHIKSEAVADVMDKLVDVMFRKTQKLPFFHGTDLKSLVLGTPGAELPVRARGHFSVGKAWENHGRASSHLKNANARKHILRECCASNEQSVTEAARAMPARLPGAFKRRQLQQVESRNLQFELLLNMHSDMLHDKERVDAYKFAIERAITRFTTLHNRKPHVLDIGTGTGLLAMMAARAGAGRVTACEMVPGMVDIARYVLQSNGFGDDKIHIVEKRSTLMSVDEDMGGSPADIVVSEVLNTDLLQECVLESVRDAVSRLAAPNAIVIPARARIFAQVIDSPLISSWSRFNDIRGQSEALNQQPLFSGVEFPIERSVGLQATQLLQHMTPLHPPSTVLTFNFTDGAEAIALKNSYAQDIVLMQSGTPHAVLSWWTVELDDDNATISTQPGSDRALREHWGQSLYLLGGNRARCGSGSHIRLEAMHDERSVWFNVSNIIDANHNSEQIQLRALLAHHSPLWPSDRIWTLNDPVRNALYIQALQKVIKGLQKNSCLMVVSDGGYLALLAALVLKPLLSVGETRKIFALEPSPNSQEFVRELMDQASLSDIVKVIGKHAEDVNASDLDSSTQSLGALVAEPYFHATVYPWSGLEFWYRCAALRRAGLLAPEAVLMPRSATLVGMLVAFSGLERSHHSVRSAGGCDYSVYDAIFAQETGGLLPGPQLWEHPHVALSTRQVLLKFEMREDPHDMAATVDLRAYTSDVKPNAVVYWLDYGLDAQGSLVARGAPDDTAQPSPNRIAIQYINEDIIASGAMAVTIDASFNAQENDVKLNLRGCN